MKVIILGAGLMGSAAAKDLSLDSQIDQIVVNDIDNRRLEEVASIDPDKISCTSVDVKDTDKTARLLEDFSVAISALPHGLSVPALKAAISAKTDAIDMVFEKEQLELDEKAREAGVLVIPGCGFAPGISNVLTKYAIDQLDSPEEAHIKVGGLPANSAPPLGYKVVFRLDSVWDEYVNEATVIRNGDITTVDPLTDHETFSFPGLGKLECAVTDGLATLPYTVKGVDTLDEKTIRYPGHYNKIKTLKQCGLLDHQPVEVNDCEIAPRDLLTNLLTPDLKLEEGERDLSVMVVEVAGLKKGKKKRYEFRLLDYYDEERDVTSMGRTTAYTSVITAKMITQGEIKASGVIAPETIIDAEQLMSRLEEKGIDLQTCIHPSPG